MGRRSHADVLPSARANRLLTLGAVVYAAVPRATVASRFGRAGKDMRAEVRRGGSSRDGSHTYILKRSNNTFSLLQAKSTECSCSLTDACSCESTMSFMACIKSACLSGACDCTSDNRFEDSCTFISGTCPQERITCEPHRATCTNQGVANACSSVDAMEPMEPPEPSLSPPRPSSSIRVGPCDGIDANAGVDPTALPDASTSYRILGVQDTIVKVPKPTPAPLTTPPPPPPTPEKTEPPTQAPEPSPDPPPAPAPMPRPPSGSQGRWYGAPNGKWMSAAARSGPVAVGPAILAVLAPVWASLLVY